MSQIDALSTERRARLAAERLLQQKQTELFAANAELSKHALSLTEEIVEKREEVAVERQAVETLRDENSQTLQELEVAHEAVDIAERRLWDSVETIEDGFAVFDANSALLAANSAFLSVFDGLESVAPGATYPEILRCLSDEGIVDIGDFNRRDWCAEMEDRWRQSALEPRTIKLWNGQFIKLVDHRSENGDTVSLALNITGTIRREEQLTEARNNAEAANRAKSAFLAKMSHELRTPMNGVVGMADLLMESSLDGEQHLYVDTIKNSGEALLKLINNVLDFSKMEATKLLLLAEEFDLERTLTEVMMLFQPAVLQKEVELLLDYDMFLPTRFVGDPGRVRQIVTNLMGNAVKFTESGHVLVRVVGLPSGDTGEMRVYITIEDTGLGIPENMVDHIFGEFNQVEDEKNRRFEGTGLGLAITKQLVELMQGEIWVDSEFGTGSSFGFHIDLPTVGPAQKLEQLPDWVTRVVMVSQPNQSASILSKQFQILGAEVVNVSPEVFGETFTMSNGDVLIMDLGRSDDKAPTLIKAVLESSTLVPAVVLQVNPNGVDTKDTPQMAYLGTQAGRREIVRAIANIEIVEKLAISGPVQLSDDFENADAIATTADPAVDKPPQLDSPRGPELIATGDARKMRILAAEDNKTNRLVFSKMVGKLNVDLEFAENGKEAVEKWQSFVPDLVFMDISMPLMDGKQATQKIRKLETPGQHTPIVALTAHAMSGDDQEILSAGLDFYLTKPLRKAAIFEQISNAIPECAEDVFE